MTQASEVTVSDAEVELIFSALGYSRRHPQQGENIRQALAAFLAKRVPEEEVEPSPYAWDDDQINMAIAHNALRAAVLKGPRE